MTLVQTLGDVELGERIRMTVDGDSTIEGEATLVDYDPEERLRVEIDGEEDSRVRRDVRADRKNGDWTTPKVRRYTPDQGDWAVRGVVTDVRIEER
ncbi:hypothetical protein V5735_21500 (plasmid) [Haladaptatus sp. SPP-AMP-3]|uniref:hypothetical protein n=1 Tax=Haladaptatus sp. SPP-AMP-3 TaxID=3121295 RepID=UPI003C2B4BA0